MTSLAKFETWISEDIASVIDARFTEDEHVYYLSGPMSDVIDFNIPLFQRAANILRERGFNIISPVEMDEAEDVDTVDRARLSWAYFMGRDVSTIIRDCDGIIMLPDWPLSKGSRIEMFVALTQSMSLLEYTDTEDWLPLVASIKPSWAMEILRVNTFATDTVL